MHRNIIQPVLFTYLLLLVLLGTSAVICYCFIGTAATTTILGLTTAKTVLVVNEYMEVRGSKRWLVAAWLTWVSATITGLIFVLKLV